MTWVGDTISMTQTNRFISLKQIYRGSSRVIIDFEEIIEKTNLMDENRIIDPCGDHWGDKSLCNKPSSIWVLFSLVLYDLHVRLRP